jgi:hypothetical protein
VAVAVGWSSSRPEFRAEGLLLGPCNTGGEVEFDGFDEFRLLPPDAGGGSSSRLGSLPIRDVGGFSTEELVVDPFSTGAGPEGGGGGLTLAPGGSGNSGTVLLGTPSGSMGATGAPAGPQLVQGGATTGAGAA